MPQQADQYLRRSAAACEELPQIVSSQGLTIISVIGIKTQSCMYQHAVCTTQGCTHPDGRVQVEVLPGMISCRSSMQPGRAAHSGLTSIVMTVSCLIRKVNLTRRVWCIWSMATVDALVVVVVVATPLTIAPVIR